MNWGKGLVLALACFAALMAWFIVKASQNPEPLVTEQYYEQELKYQERIDATARAQELGPVHIVASGESVRLSFPASVHGHPVTGELMLQRPNDPTADRTFVVKVDDDGSFAATGAALVPGRYNAQLTWKVDSVPYYTEEKLIVP